MLDQTGEYSHAFKVMHAYLKLYEQSEKAAILAATENDARRCVILAIKAVDVINFAELINLSAIKQLTQKHQKVFTLLNLFTEATCAEFKNQLSNYRDLMTTEGLTEQELIVKKSYVQICTLNTQVTNFSYTELAQLLNVSHLSSFLTQFFFQIDVDEIEMWAIEAIQNNIIDAKIDQLNELIVIKSHMLREIKLQEWKAIQGKIRAWKERFQRVQSIMGAAQQAQ